MESSKGRTPDDWLCVDCGFNTAPGIPSREEFDRQFAAGAESVGCTIGPDSEVYMVRDRVWKQAGIEGMGGCLCIGCLERRIGRRLKPKDFAKHEFNVMPGTERLLSRRGRIPGTNSYVLRPFRYAVEQRSG